MAIPEVPKQQIDGALARFDDELRDSSEWTGWQDKRNHRYAIERDGRLYPLKEIIRQATGYTKFSGGLMAAKYVEKHGFEVVPLREEHDLIFEFEQRDMVEGIAGTEWRKKIGPILQEELEHRTERPLKRVPVYNNPFVYFFDKDHVEKLPSPKLFFALDGAGFDYQYGLYVEKGLSTSANQEEIMGPDWSWHKLEAGLKDESFLDKLKEMLTQGSYEILVHQIPGPIYTFRPSGDELERTEKKSGMAEPCTWDSFKETLFTLPDDTWCDFYIRRNVAVPEDRRIDLKPILDAYEELWPFLEDILPEMADELFLIGATVTLDELEQRPRFLKEHGKVTLWHSFPIKEPFKGQLEKQQKFTLYIYNKGKMPIACNVIEFATKPGLEGMESPWPEYTLEDERGRTSAGPGAAQIFKTWTLVDTISPVEPPLSLADFESYSDHKPIVPVSLKGGFGFARRRDAAVNGHEIYTYFHERGFHFPNEIITDYCLSLMTKPFVILSGISGTGKTKIAQVFADYMCPPTEVVVNKVPENGAGEFYIKVGKAVYNSAVLGISGSLVEYFDLPDKGQTKSITIDFADKSLVSSMRNYDFTDPKYSQYIALHIRKELLNWIRNNFAVGDYIKAAVLDEERTHFRFDMFTPEKQTIEEQRVCFIPVRPDWMDNRGLLGFYNLLTDKYEATPLLKLLLRAASDPDRPYFVILDEMNLAKVEYYFSDFLSVMESRLVKDGKTEQEAIQLHDREEIIEFADSSGREYAIPAALRIPENVYFTGTVNVDETTYMFSPKVLDRANTIEFNEVDLESYGMGQFPETGLQFSLEPGVSLDGHFGKVTQATRADYERLSDETKEYLEKAHSILSAEHLHFGYRVANEIGLYIQNAVELAGSESEQDALDFQLLQKVMPKFHGSRQKLEKPLLKLLAFCFDDPGDDLEYSKAVAEYEGRLKDGVFPRTAEKVLRMLKSLGQQGFVSFIE